jgi:glucose-6-phosphate 1-dehydrogenase
MAMTRSVKAISPRASVDNLGFATFETLLYDPTLFSRADLVATAWSIAQPILDVWSSLSPRDFPNYLAGTWGPKDAEELMTQDGRHWRRF